MPTIRGALAEGKWGVRVIRGRRFHRRLGLTCSSLLLPGEAIPAREGEDSACSVSTGALRQDDLHYWGRSGHRRQQAGGPPVTSTRDAAPTSTLRSWRDRLKPVPQGISTRTAEAALMDA